MKLSIFAHTMAVAFAVSCPVVATAAGADVLGIHVDTGDLYSISTADASLTLIGNTGVASLGSLEFAPDGTLYGFTVGVDPSLYTINPATAEATEIRPLNLGTDVFEGGLAFSPDGTAFGTNGGTANSPLLFGLDLANGLDYVIGALDGGARHDIGGLAWRGGESGTLIGLDRVSGSLLLIDPGDASTSILRELNAGIQAGVIGGMALLSSGGPQEGTVGYFSTAAATGTNALYWFDPVSGDHALIGEFDPDVISGAGIGGLAIVPEPASLVLLVLGGLTLLHRRRK